MLSHTFVARRSVAAAWLTLAAMALFTVAPANASTSGGGDDPVLTRTVTISGEAGVTPVFIDREVSVGGQRTFRDFVSSPDDAFAAIVLVQDPPTIDSQGVFFGRGLGSSARHLPFSAPIQADAPKSDDRGDVLPPGRYLLHLLAEEGVEVSVSFTADGAPAGTTTLTPTADSVLQTSRPANDLPPGGLVSPYTYSGGAAFDLESDGMLMDITSYRYDTVESNDQLGCSYFKQRPRADALLPYAPGECPEVSAVSGTRVLASGYAVDYGFAAPLDAGTYARGQTRRESNNHPLVEPFTYIVFGLEFAPK